MNHSKIFLYIAGALFFAMCGSLWQEFVASHNSHLNPESLNPESLNPVLRASDGAERSERNTDPRYYAVPKAAVESFEFDPNEADSSQLLRLGLTPAQVRSIYRHRARGYAYSRVEDFARTPFMTKGQWAHLKPLVRIGDQYRLLNVTDNRPPITDNRSPITDNRSPITDNRNTITDNRPPLTVPTLHLNDDGFKTLLRHPFMSYEQVKAVKNFQRKYGRIRNMTELLILPEFTVEDTLRLSPYLQF